MRQVYQEFLRDRSKVQELVELFDPIVRVVDKIAGERVSMRVRQCKKKQLITVNICIYFHSPLVLINFNNLIIYLLGAY